MVAGWQAYAGSPLAVVFVHGATTGARACWSAPDGSFWPDLLSSDPRFLRPDIFLSQWSGAVLSRDGGLQHCARELFSQLSREDAEGRPGPLAWPRIVFVTQGAGALLVEYLLSWQQAAFRHSRLALYRCTPPGSLSCPVLLRPLLPALHPGLFADHCRSDPLWRDVELRFEDLRAAGTLDLECLTALAQQGPRLLPWDCFKRWRLPLQALGAQPGIRHFPDSDPRSLTRPVDVRQPVHLGLLDFLLEHRFLQPPATDLRHHGSLFQRYLPRLESHYLERGADRELERLLRHYSIWIWGRAGLGKSVAALRALQRRSDFLRVSLGSCVDASPPELCREILRALQDEDAPPASSLTFRQCLQALLALLRARSRDRDFGLLIEDIPLADARAFAAFSRYLLTVLAAMADSRFRLIVTSAQPPASDWQAERQSLRECFRVLEWQPWEQTDLIRLATRIAADTDLRFEDGLLPHGGDPRQLKTRFRDRLLGLDPVRFRSAAPSALAPQRQPLVQPQQLEANGQ